MMPRHDEYWTSPMRDAVDAFVTEGGPLQLTLA
jgi:hypothetical protein